MRHGIQEAEILGKLGVGLWIQCEDDKSDVRISDCSGSRRVRDVVKGRAEKAASLQGEGVQWGGGSSQRCKKQRGDTDAASGPLSVSG